MNISKIVGLKSFFIDFELFLYSSQRFDNGMENLKGDAERFIRRYRKKHVHCKSKKKVMDNYLGIVKSIDESEIIPFISGASAVLEDLIRHTSKMVHCRADFSALFDSFRANGVTVLLEAIPPEVVPGALLFVGQSDWQTSFDGEGEGSTLCAPLGFYSDWDPKLVSDLCFTHGFLVRMGGADTCVKLTERCVLNCFLVLPMASLNVGTYLMPSRLALLYGLAKS